MGDPRISRVEPHWKGRGTAAAAVARKEVAAAKPPRDFVAEAKATINAFDQNPSTIAAVIFAQALDRFGERLVDAAAVSQYKRSP